MKLEGKIVVVMALVLAMPLVVSWCAHPVDAGRIERSAPLESPPET